MTQLFFRPLVGLSLLSASLAAAESSSPELADIAVRQDLTIVVTDSGLGGLSVVADIARRARETGSHQSIEIIFYNALFDAETGYNSLPDRDEKVRIFNNALTDMGRRYDADLIMVACNTLSVLLPDCSYAQEGAVPVLGIVEAGVELIDEALTRTPNSRVVIFATPTTVEENSHNAALLARGHQASRIIQQPCQDLTFYIEQDFEGFDTELMISAFVADAAAHLDDPATPIYASFNCTHFGYSSTLWQQEIEAAGLKLAGMINPNDRMGDFLFTPATAGRAESPSITVRAVGMVPISAAAIDSISRAVEGISPETAEALRNHEVIEGLFER